MLERERWKKHIHNNQQASLQDIYKFIKHNNIPLTDIEKQMIINAHEMSKDEIKKATQNQINETICWVWEKTMN